jgi:hypothetical protein
MLRKSQKGKLLLKVIFYSVIIATSFFLGAINNTPYLQFETKINLTDIFTTVVTAGLTLSVAWFITRAIEKDKEDYKNEKELFLRRTEDVNKIVEESYNKISSGTVLLVDVTSALKRIDVALEAIHNMTARANLTIDSQIKSELTSNNRQLNNLLTDTGITPPGTTKIPDVAVNNGLITLSPNRVIEAQATFDELKTNILRFQLAIINA